MTQKSDAAPTSSAVIASDPAEAGRVQEQIEASLRARRTPDPIIFGIKLAVDEAIQNAIKHGNQLDRSKKVRVTWRVQHDRFEISIHDEGPGFDPTDVPDPTDVENLDRPCGRGLLLMRHYMTEVVISPPGNAVRMYKVLRNGTCP